MSKPTPTETYTDTNNSSSTAMEDSLSATLKNELTQYSCNGYLDPSDPTMITAADRKALVDWCYGVVDHYQLSRETVAVAMEMVDRFLSISAGPFALWHANSDVAEVGNNALHCQSEFQLLTAAALCSSLKVMGNVVSSDQFVESYCSAYTKEDIENMEHTVQKGLSWRSNTSPSRIGTSLLSLLVSYLNLPEATWAFLLDEMKYQTELAVQDYYFSTHRPSTIALAATFNAIESIGSKAHEEMLNSFLARILECFGYGQSMHMSTARSRLQRLLRGEDVDEVGAGTTKKKISSSGAHDSTKTSNLECDSIFSSDYLDPDLLESVDDFMTSFSMDCEDNPVASFPASTATSTTASPGNNLKKPARPMPAYHMFLQLEREFIIQTMEGEDADKSIHDEKVYLDYVPERYRQIKLSPDWYLGPDKRKRRKHRKQHGKIGHKELTLTISSRWAELGQTNPEVKRFVQDLAERELMEYRREMEEYEKHHGSNMAPSTESKNTSKRTREEDVTNEESAPGKPPQKQSRLIPTVSTSKTVQEKDCPLEETIKLCLSTISTDLKTFGYRPVTKVAASNRVPHDRERISRRITVEDSDSEDLGGFNL